MVATGLSRPLIALSPPGDPRLFIGEQDGLLKVLEDGKVLATPFLDIASLISGANEQGLLGLAFHPDYARNRLFFVHYTDTAGDTQVVRYSARADDPNRADTTAPKPILSQDQPRSNHNGGELVFGPDGFLYLGLGDGGKQGDPDGNAQNLNTFLGKILRLNIDSEAAYTIPATNPFAARSGVKKEIWAYGVRNPWRFSFDRDKHDLYVGDVGQDKWEEIDVQPASSKGGENYGWNTLEGNECYAPATDCDMSGKVPPVHVTSHGDGNCAVIGGFVYRGCRMPGYHGHYFFGDNCTGKIESLVWKDGKATELTRWPTLDLEPYTLTSFGQDSTGELYLTDRSGTVYRIAPAP
jgi:glucose/arabinose dehydrogenase